MRPNSKIRFRKKVWMKPGDMISRGVLSHSEKELLLILSVNRSTFDPEFEFEVKCLCRSGLVRELHFSFDRVLHETHVGSIIVMNFDDCKSNDRSDILI